MNPSMSPTPDYEVREVAHGSPEYLNGVELRRVVLRRPLGLDYTPEQLAGEAGQFHLAAVLTTDAHAIPSLAGQKLSPPPTVIGVVSLGRRHDNPSAGQLRQAAIHPALQGSGVGRALSGRLEAIARREGMTEIILHSREVARGFYERLGYQAEGEQFLEVGIPHVKMRKRL